METLRVYELARTYGVSSKELLEILRQAGFSVPSHMASLSDQELKFLEKKFLNPKELTGDESTGDKSGTKVVKEIVTAQAKIDQAPKAPIKKQEDIVHKVNVKDESEKNKVLKSASIKEVDPEGITIEPMVVSDFATRAKRSSSEVILTLLRMGTVAAKNQVISEDVVAHLAAHYNIKKIEKQSQSKVLQGMQIVETSVLERPPVVVIVGHVDHGKTTLLDYIRKTKVAEKEKGGITQHLGAYEVHTSHGNIIFLDTPGHEAFSNMRGRGIGVADIVILIVAVDDGIMPQTIEAINFAKEAKLPIIVAVNKMDKADSSRLDVIRRGLAQHNLLPEEWGGDVVCLPISAKKGQGVDALLEMIILQAQLLELKADPSRPAIGHILEAKPEKGRGPIATVLCKNGSIAIGDYFECGSTVGKVSSLVNSDGLRIKQVGPSVPVQVAGFEALPEVGSLFKVVPVDQYRTAKSQVSERRVLTQKVVSEGGLNLLIKTDSISTKEALLGSLKKLTKKVGEEFNVIHAGVGAVNEGDVMLASSTGCSIIALHVKPEINASIMARNYNVSIDVFDIIYKLLEYLEEQALGRKKVEMIQVKIGQATVRQVFAIKNVGVVAGCYVQEGRFTRDGKVIILRRGKEIGRGLIKSLQRDRKSVKEVHTGFECGFVVAGFEDFLPDDQIDCYIEQPAS